MKNNKAFTLVELIVVVTILGILATIGFVSYAGYLSGVRDGNRTAQLVSIHDALVLYSTNKDLPTPDDGVTVYNSGTLLGIQGYAGETVLNDIDFLKGGKDPKDGDYFTYYRSKSKRDFQLMAYLEDSENLLIDSGFTKNTHAVADDLDIRVPSVFGARLGILMEETTNIPLQEISAYKSAKTINLADSGVTENFTVYFKSDDKFNGTSIAVLAKINATTAIASQTANIGVLSGFPSLSTIGNGHNCIVQGGDLKCWGSNHFGELGHTNTIGTPTGYAIPIALQLSGVKQVSLGTQFTCFLFDELNNGKVQCIGRGITGQLGDGTLTSTPKIIPVDVQVEGTNANLVGATQIASGQSFTCVLMSDSTVKCWGSPNTGYALGDGSSGVNNRANTVTGLTGVTQITAGIDHMCALMLNNTVKCWGINAYGKLGTGNEVPTYTPTEVVGLTDVVQVSAGQNHSCATLIDKTVKCWGRNNYGQIGVWSNGGASILSPNKKVGDYIGGSIIGDVEQVKVGGDTTCMLMSNKSIKCFGRDAGLLGDGATDSSGYSTNIKIVDVIGISNAKQLMLGTAFACALLEDNTAKCWGGDYALQLGDGSPSAIQHTPVLVTGL